MPVATPKPRETLGAIRGPATLQPENLGRLTAMQQGQPTRAGGWEKKKRGEKERTRESRTVPDVISSDDRTPLLRAAVKHNDLTPKNGKGRTDAEIHAH